MDYNNNCILCYRVCLSSKSNKSEKISVLLDAQVSVIFILRKLMEIPKEFCENLLSSAGDPSEWITSCDNCTELIKRAHNTFKEVILLQSRFESFKSKIKTTISNSQLENTVPINKSINTTDSIRNYLFKALVPLNCVPKLDPDLVIKVENQVDVNEENDWLPVNYDEEYKIAKPKDSSGKGIFNTKKKKRKNSPASDVEDEDAYNPENNSDGDSDWEAGEGNATHSDTESDKSGPDEKRLRGRETVPNDFDHILKERKTTCDDCGKTFPKPSKLKQHVMCRHTKNFPHKCHKCNITFKTGTGLKRHCARKHPDTDLQAVTLGKLPCDICGQSFNADYIKYHLLTHGKKEDKKFMCEICQKFFDRTDILKIHQRGEHYKELNLEPYQCKKCNKIFKNKKNLRGHEAVVHKVNVSFSCSVCDAAFRNKLALQKHKERMHNSEKFPCSECGKVFNDKPKLESHISARHSRHECNICKRFFPRMDKLRIHQRGVHHAELNLEPYKCTVCDQFFKSKVNLRHHTIQKHTKEFSVFCSICNAGFFDNGNLSLHVRRVHDQEKNYTCSYCGMAFFFKQTFETHVISQHTKEYAVTCEICGHGSATNHLHEKHMKTHDDKTFTCELCGDAFKLQYQLQEHQRGRHHEELGLEPFKCTDCGRICNSRSTLRVHFIRQHTKSSNFPCSQCDKIFLSNQRLRDHTRRHHTGEKPYNCDICNESFFTNKQKQRHLEKHPEKYKCTICSKQFEDAWQLSLHIPTHGFIPNTPQTLN